MTYDDKNIETERAIDRARAYAADAWKATRDQAEARFHDILDGAERAWRRRRNGGWDDALRKPLAAALVVGAAIGVGMYLARRRRVVSSGQPVDAA